MPLIRQRKGKNQYTEKCDNVDLVFIFVRLYWTKCLHSIFEIKKKNTSRRTVIYESDEVHAHQVLIASLNLMIEIQFTGE